jgi:hypothetical protein
VEAGIEADDAEVTAARDALAAANELLDAEVERYV